MADIKSEWPLDINQSSRDTEEQCDVDTKPYLCDVCSEAFILKADLNAHYEIHTEKDKFICELCNMNFDDNFSLDLHSVSHSFLHKNASAYTCACGKGFKSKAGFSLHTKSLLEKKYICEICTKIFCNKTLLNAHSVTHEGKKPYVCRICRKCFTQHNQFLRHYRICRKARHRASKLKDNLNPVDEERRYSDSELSDETSPNISLTKSKGKQFVCKVCKKIFALKETLHTHYRISPDHKPFSCNICKASFIKNHTLMKHYRFHTKEKPHVCDICSKGFYDKDALKEHKHYSHSK